MRVRFATLDDVDPLVRMMGEFYAETSTPFAAGRVRGSFERLVQEPALGRVWIVEEGDGSPAGYVVLTLGFSMEFGGIDAFVDDLFLRPGHRGRGLGSALLDEVLAECRRRGVRALHLEVARENTAARELYRKFGFVNHDRILMTREMGAEES
jgi:ribosomal protein S18 acetylase RimI-like enzyme